MLLDKLYCTVKRCRLLNLCMRWSPFYDITVMKWIGILSIIICCLRVWRDLGLILESLKSVVKIDFSVFCRMLLLSSCCQTWVRRPLGHTKRTTRLCKSISDFCLILNFVKTFFENIPYGNTCIDKLLRNA